MQTCAAFCASCAKIVLIMLIFMLERRGEERCVHPYPPSCLPGSVADVESVIELIVECILQLKFSTLGMHCATHTQKCIDNFML